MSEHEAIAGQLTEIMRLITDLATEQSKMAMVQNQYTACVENLQIAKLPKSDVKSRTPEVAGGLDVPLGSSVDTTRGPSLGMGGGLPLDPAPWVRERDMQSSSPYHFG